MAEQRRGLGRGLSALLGEVEAAVAPEPAAGATAAAGGQEVAIELLRRNPDQPRKLFGEQELDDLSASIREKGVLQPILVRPMPGGYYQIVAGERRWRAAQKAGLHAVPVLVRELDDLAVLEIAIVENVQRADLSPLEEAMGYRALIDRFGHTQEAVAQVVGKSRSHVANALRLLNLPEEVRDHLEAGRLSAGHARAIATAADPIGLARTIVEKDLSVRQAEALSRQAAEKAPAKPNGRPARGGDSSAVDPDIEALVRDLSDTVGMKIDLAYNYDEERGTLSIRFNTLDQLDELCHRLSQGRVRG